MTYPKPLSAKTIAARFADSGLSAKKIDFLHRLFGAAAQLYGTIILSDLWNVYKELADMQKVPKITKADIKLFSSIARREDVPYYIYEIDELYSEEERNPWDRFIILKEIVGGGWYKLNIAYNLIELQIDKPFYIPSDLLSYEDGIPPAEEELKLKAFIDCLESTADILKASHGRRSEKSPHKGKRLNEFSYATFFDRSEIEYYQDKYEKNPGRRDNLIDSILKDSGRICSERLFDKLRFWTVTGRIEPPKIIEYILSDLEEVGVELSKSQLEEFIDLIMNYQNSAHLYCNRGWTPQDLANRMRGNGPITISMGPGMQKMIEEGTIDLNEIRKELEERGIQVLLPENLT